MTVLECFNEFETWRLFETFIGLKEDEVLKKNIYAFFLFVTNLINVGSIFEERANNTPLQFIFKTMILEIE